MNPMMLLLIFAGVAGLVGAVAFLMRGSGNDRVTERLDQLVGRGGPKDSSADLLLRQALNDVDRKTLLERFTPEFLKVSKTFEQADVNMKPSVLFGVSLALAAAGGIASLMLVNVYVAPVGALVMFTMPWGWLYMKRAGRLKKFASQLPDAMELVARALRAGHSLAAGLHVVAEEMPDPVAKEFRRVYEEQNLGISLEDALDNMCNRVPNLDLRFFVTSVNIQRQTGGDLAEILDRIGHVIRKRFKILGQVKALTAEGRLSGIVLIAMPIGLFLMMLYMKPDYIQLLWTEPMGVKMSIGAIVLMLIGSYAIKKIVDIKV
jgi:tight adherence protein B